MHVSVCARDDLRAPAWMGGALVVVAASAASLTFFLPHVLNGPAVMNGSARGTALVVLMLAVPGLATGVARGLRGSTRWLGVWLGSVAYLAYNAVMFCFATPFNRLFLLYVAMLMLSIWSLVVVVTHARPSIVDGARIPHRAVAAYLWVVAFLNAALWLRTVVRALGDADPAFLAGTGLPTNPVYVQDLAFWLPAMAGVGYLLWHRSAWGVLLTRAGLSFWTLESIGVAVDQWFAHRADPGSPVASAGAVELFVGMSLVGLVPLFLSFRRSHGLPAQPR